ncbi:16S rRNA (cytosine(1402)-N(4))-methyltransferase RsmH [Alloscardovia theropitheci]|uniref:Ribosomal RNA small subunit methyltransferase H n=1 Tax=Alloscardovia theropitheci TaxID=2496842 RepID=A0A4R0QP39_9BIFI|nr:16S rRNA (cytosine(1402)-N(4))-methyltransferase RsmH [Alloscardovia theropitheci]TCD53973.1 16S rRNA (cytosine(1402)-N(4))-methyltransferase RsmH [Alloscardovia theropitheci]
MVDLERISSIHKPVLFDECVELVTRNVEKSAHDDGREFPVIVDCTLGLAGHTSGFLKEIPNVRVIGIDRDEEALALATARVREQGFEDRFIPAHAAFDEFSQVISDAGFTHVDAVFMDLGLSSLQIDETERGFSYSHDAPLDMRMDTTQSLTAAEILRTYEYGDLVRIFKEFGEERFSGPIAREIIRKREAGEFILTSYQLTDVVDSIVPKAKRPAGNPAKRVFQAMRIEVNGELTKLAQTLPQALKSLPRGGRLVVESYHSLEDKCVKKFFSRGLVAHVPPGLPVIPDDAQPYLKDLTRGAMMADEEEIKRNSRSASVRLRAVQVTREVPQSAFRDEEHQRVKRSDNSHKNFKNKNNNAKRNNSYSKGNHGRRSRT